MKELTAQEFLCVLAAEVMPVNEVKKLVEKYGAAKNNATFAEISQLSLLIKTFLQTVDNKSIKNTTFGGALTNTVDQDNIILTNSVDLQNYISSIEDIIKNDPKFAPYKSGDKLKISNDEPNESNHLIIESDVNYAPYKSGDTLEAKIKVGEIKSPYSFGRVVDNSKVKNTKPKRKKIKSKKNNK